MRGWIKAILVILILLGGYYGWGQLGRDYATPPAETSVKSIEVFGADAGHGNLVGIQPYMIPSDYATGEAFYDVDPADLNTITLGEAWDKYAIAGRLPPTSVPNGMLVCLRGQIWDLGSDGWTVVVRQGQVFEMPRVDGAALANLWL